jgi:hypothetical protein
MHRLFRRSAVPLPLALRSVPRSAWACALILLSALPIRAQDADPLLRLDAASRFAIDAMIDSANAMSLPGTVLRLKALEGVRKKAEAKKIVEALRKKFSYLKTAQVVLGSVGPEELDAASAVLEAGAKPNQLQVFRTRQKGRSDLEAFTTWADLMTRGVPDEEASSAIIKLWQDGADDMTFRRLQIDVQTDISLGLNPGAALRNRIREAPSRNAAKPSTPPEG